MHRALATTALSAAVSLAVAMQGAPTRAAEMDKSEMMKMMMEKMQKEHLEKCYGINAVAKNDCSEGVHSCSGSATQARDPKSFVLVPAGLCTKIAGGRLTPA